nr:LamG domain-containing protein [Armatimonadota bacterium]
MKTRQWAAMAAVWMLAAGALTPGAAWAQGTSPAAEWNFDEGTGGVAADSLGQGSGAVLQGGAGWAKGLIGANALHLSGQTADADIPKPVIDTSQSYTVMAWVKLNAIQGFQTIASIDGANVSGFFLQMRADTGQFAFAALPSDNVDAKAVIASATEEPDSGRWYHLTGVHDAAANTNTLYVDGVKQQTVAAPAAWKATGHTAIGRGFFGSKPVDYVNGDIDDVRFYQSALPASDIAALVKPDLPPVPPAVAPTLNINAAGPTVRVSPMLYGLMTEEINYSYDGGLYA